MGGLTFQLAADIVESAFSPSWDEIGRLAPVAAIRTFVNFFLERDLAQLERREAASSRHTVAGTTPEELLAIGIADSAYWAAVIKSSGFRAD